MFGNERRCLPSMVFYPEVQDSILIIRVARYLSEDEVNVYMSTAQIMFQIP